jgi:sulfopyruvate decarboxylase subunit beta
MDQVKEELVVSNIGDPSKELFYVKDRPKNFYMLGSLGLASSISLGLALSQNDKVICLDGDGSLLSNLGSLATLANNNPSNLVLIILDNGAYGTTGYQSSYSDEKTDLRYVAEACGFTKCFKATDEVDLSSALKSCLDENFLCMIHVLIERNDEKMELIPLDPLIIKNRFMDSIKNKVKIK